MVQKLEKWTPSTGFQTRVPIRWRLDAVDPSCKKAIHHGHNAVEEVGMLAMNDYCDGSFQLSQRVKHNGRRPDVLGKKRDHPGVP